MPRRLDVSWRRRSHAATADDRRARRHVAPDLALDLLDAGLLFTAPRRHHVVGGSALPGPRGHNPLITWGIEGSRARGEHLFWTALSVFAATAATGCYTRTYSNNYSTMSEYMIGYHECLALLRRRVAEAAPGRIQLLVGPRQVGKTTLLLELAAGLGDAAMYAACDGPEAALPGFWERLWTDVERRADNDRVVVMLDEAHLLPAWASRLKAEWDRLRRRRVPVHIIATGSSALRLGSGSRESLAGRFERVTLTHWSAASLASAFRLDREQAVKLYVERGAYPGAISLLGEPARWAAYVRDAIIEPAIGRDILALGPVRRPALLRQVFGVAVASPAAIVTLQKIQGLLHDAGALETIAHYLHLLEEAYLVAGLPKHASRPVRRRAAPPKLITLNQALLAATASGGVPSSQQEPDRFGQWLENACLAFAWNSGQHVAYWREEPWDVDGVLDGTWGRWAIEVKSGRFTPTDLRGLLEFVRRFPTYRPLVVCDASAREAATRAGVAAISWPEYLWGGPSVRTAT